MTIKGTITTMKAEELNMLLRAADLGDDFLENNLLFDMDFTDIPKKDLRDAVAYANHATEWYFNHMNKYYLLADCNRFHLMFVGHMQEWFTRVAELKNPAIGRAYGLWEGQPHMWNWAVSNKKLVHINWGGIVDSPNYSGKGSIAA